MPKRGGKYNPGRNNWNAGQNFGGKFRDDHDDRMKDNTRRVSFKTNRDRRGGMRKNYELSVRTHLQEEDIDMSGLGASTQVRRAPSGRGGARRGDRHDDRKRNSPLPNRKLLPGPAGFYQVFIPHMRNYDKDFILKAIQSSLHPDSYHPLYFKQEQDRVTFYIDDFTTAEKILKLDRLITLPDGFKMIIKVRSSMPQFTINETLREKMMLVMGKRFNPAMKALDLSNFHSDPDLSDVYCSLARPQIMIEAISVIASRIPDLVALNLDNNKIHITDHMKCIAEKLPNITILHLKDNKLTHTSRLEYLKKLSLTELVLDGNPLKSKFRENSAYVREVRKIFPKLVKLDGTELPPEISFDLAEAMDLPTSNASFLCHPAAEDIVRQFLQQYFAIYDSASRQPLLDAYHENAIMTLSAYFPNDRTTSYNKFNRNLYRCRDNDSRNRTLKEGRLRVVSYLSELPKTQHDPMSFQVDLSFFSPLLMLLSVTGVFKELNGESSPPIRSFQRAMIIVPAGSGFCIRNDELCVTNASPSQIKSAFNPPAETPVAAVPVPNAALAGVVPVTNVLDDATKQQLVQQMSMHSNMNLQWSEKCLMETNWDLQRAMFVFMELNKENKVPPEAFVK